MAVEIGKGGVQPVIPFLSDPGGNKEEIRNRAMSGLGACWAAARHGGRLGGVGLRVGGRDNCDIHTHAHSRREADG